MCSSYSFTSVSLPPKGFAKVWHLKTSVLGGTVKGPIVSVMLSALTPASGFAPLLPLLEPVPPLLPPLPLLLAPPELPPEPPLLLVPPLLPPLPPPEPPPLLAPLLPPPLDVLAPPLPEPLHESALRLTRRTAIRTRFIGVPPE